MSEPIAIEYQHEETGVIGYVDLWQVEQGFFKSNPRLQEIGPLYRHPPDVRTAELERENSALRESEKRAKIALKRFRDNCVSLTGSLWPQNETTEYLSELLNGRDGIIIKDGV